MDFNLIREQSNKTAARLGYPINNALPLLDEVQKLRSVDLTVKRLLCLHAAAACAYGFNNSKAIEWLRQESAFDDLAASERRFIENGEGDTNRFKIQIEGMWALAWALGIVSKIEFDKGCDSKFAVLLPNLKISESSARFRSQIKSRLDEEIFAACDLAYCLHWAIRQAELNNNKLPGKVQAYVIEERRRALEWLFSNDLWDEVVLDT